MVPTKYLKRLALVLGVAALLAAGAAADASADPVIATAGDIACDHYRRYASDVDLIFVYDQGKGTIEGCDIFANADAGVEVGGEGDEDLARTVTGRGAGAREPEPRSSRNAAEHATRLEVRFRGVGATELITVCAVDPALIKLAVADDGPVGELQAGVEMKSAVGESGR